LNDPRAIDENGAPCEPRFFARAAWLAAIPLAWACSLAIILGVQGLSGAVQEARGPAHYHAHDGGPAHDHHHAGVERHHHGADAAPIVVDDADPGSEAAARTAKGGFDVLPFAVVPAILLHARRGGACASPFLVPSPEPSFTCERPPASTRA
jgi:hypothetical protein